MFKLCVLVVATLVLGPEAVKGIIGGEDAALNEFPYYVFLLLGHKDLCGGALITRYHVLTAGHCVAKAIDSPNIPVTAVVGANDRTRGSRHPIAKQETYRADRSKKGWSGDIGIFTLQSRVELVDGVVRTVNLPENGNIESRSPAVLSAAGFVRPSGPESEVLQKAIFPVINSTECASLMPKKYTIDGTLICTLPGRGMGLCNGDSGAPLVQGTVIIGIAVGGESCAKGLPDVFVNVHHYRDWIDSTIKDVSDPLTTTLSIPTPQFTTTPKTGFFRRKMCC